MDEPTAVLTPQEAQGLFEILRSLAKEGKAIIFITHKLGEVIDISDRITVMRHGKVVATTTPRESSPADLARLMVGRPVMLQVDKRPARPGKPVMQLHHLVVEDERHHTAVNGVELEVRSGEIVGIAGVEGNGQNELVEALVGLRQPRSGTILLNGRDVTRTSARTFISLGVGHIPADRHRMGIVMEHSIADNLVLATYDRRPFASGIVRQLSAVWSYAKKLIKSFDIRAGSPGQPVGSLSGGNQQKVVAARELGRNPKVLIASQPTRGLDVGSIVRAGRGSVAGRPCGRHVPRPDRRRARRQGCRAGAYRLDDGRSSLIMNPRSRAVVAAVLLPVMSVVAGFVVAGLAVALSGSDPWQSFYALFQGAFINPRALPETLVATTPYIFLGLGVGLGFRAGLFNIGAEGQFYIGALFGVFIGYSLHGLPTIVHVLLALLAGILGGFLWAAVPGILKARFGAHEVITTIMLNYVAFALVNFLINNGPMVDKSSSAPRTPYIDPAAQLPILASGTRLHAGLLLALLAIPVVWFLLDRTTIGFRIRTVGFSPTAARAAGISVAWTLLATMGLSGGLAGIAGADEVLGVSHYMPPSFSTGYGFDAIAVALLARSNPWAILPAAFLFGALSSGSRFMQFQTQVSADVISVVQATVIMFIAAPVLFQWIFRLRRAPAPAIKIASEEGVL